MRKRGEDMPLYGKITRVGKGKYEVMIKFVISKRMLHKEQLRLPNKGAVQRFFLREYPTLIWGEPKHLKVKPMKQRNPIARDLRTPKYRPRVVKSKKVYNRKRKTK